MQTIELTNDGLVTAIPASASLSSRKRTAKTARKQRARRCYFGSPSFKRQGFPPKMRSGSL
jgi:hypothetical protein